MYSCVIFGGGKPHWYSLSIPQTYQSRNLVLSVGINHESNHCFFFMLYPYQLFIAFIFLSYFQEVCQTSLWSAWTQFIYSPLLTLWVLFWILNLMLFLVFKCGSKTCSKFISFFVISFSASDRRGSSFWRQESDEKKKIGKKMLCKKTLCTFIYLFPVFFANSESSIETLDGS